MPVTVRIPTPLRSTTNGQSIIELDPGTLGDLLDSMDSQYPGMKDRLTGEDGEIRNFVNVYVNGEDIQFLAGMNTGLNDGDEITIVPAVAGG